MKQAIASFWARRKRQVLFALAGILSAGEAAVGAGIALPGSETIPPALRAIAIGTLCGCAFLMRVAVEKEEGVNG